MEKQNKVKGSVDEKAQALMVWEMPDFSVMNINQTEFGINFGTDAGADATSDAAIS